MLRSCIINDHVTLTKKLGKLWALLNPLILARQCARRDRTRLHDRERTEMDRLQQTNSDRGEYTIQIPTVTVTVIVTVAVAVAMAVAVAVAVTATATATATDAVAVMTVAVSLILAGIGTPEIMMTMTLRCYEPLTTISKNSPLNLVLWDTVVAGFFRGHHYYSYNVCLCCCFHR